MLAEVAQYGTWASPISPELVVAASVGVSSPASDDGTVYWLESRPAEAGRVVVVRWDASNGARDVTPEGFSARTRVHEYGGGSYLVQGGTVVFSNWSDQRLWRQDGWGEPKPITPDPQPGESVRYADGRMTPGSRALVCVRETHPAPGRPADVVNDIVVVRADGAGDERRATGGHDFFAYPRPSPDGSLLAWISWDHPDMPWDSTELWVARLGEDDVAAPVRIAGGPGESVLEPAWGPGGELWFLSDRSGWWNLHRAEAGELAAALGGGSAPVVEPVLEVEAEFGGPLWSLGQSTLAPLPDGRIICKLRESGTDLLAVVAPGDGKAEHSSFDRLGLELSTIEAVATFGERVLMVAASATQNRAVFSVDPDRATLEEVRAPDAPGIGAERISVPTHVEFASSDGRRAHGMLYGAKSPDFVGPQDQRPPLLVNCHGGPTGAARSSLNLAVQYWTSRGFAYLDVDYGGSTGYGRAYRELLAGSWGQVDVEDTIAAAEQLTRSGEVDGRRMAVRGGSAGGYTALLALVRSDVFAAGAVYYGVSDLGALARDTHKFESHYTDRLVGPYPEAAALYSERSPATQVEAITAPVIMFQGLEDEIVPPAQTETMAASLRSRGVRVEALFFEGEQHGFRRSETVVSALRAELRFYVEVMGLASQSRSF